MQRAVSITWLLAVVACGGSTPPKKANRSDAPPASLVATPTGPDDVQVASVNDRPVYGSCVTAQAARGATKQQALEQCIDFELLAQAAARYATDPEVVDETRKALASQVIAKEYEDKFDKPEDFGSFWDRIIAKNITRLDHEEARSSAYARILVEKDAPPDVEAKAHAVAEELATALANERGLTATDLEETAKRVVGDRAKLDLATVPTRFDNGALVPAYGKALFAIPEAGRTTGPVRTPWGWDVILLTDLFPAEHPTKEQLAAKVLPDVKRSYFTQWTTEVAKNLGITVKIYDDKVPLLEDL